MTSFYTIALYWIVGSLFVIMDITNKPSFLRKYKTQPEAHIPLEKKEVFKALRRVLFNQVVVGIPSIHFLFWFNPSADIRTVPTFQRLMFNLFVMGFVYEFAFYFSHRLLHHPKIYKHVHKVHHEWTAPFSVMAIYAHWFGL